MELLPVCFLDYINDRNGLEEEDCKEFFRQILIALNHCHSKGVAHRDLKLENIMMKDQTLKFIDFGHSSSLES